MSKSTKPRDTRPLVRSPIRITPAFLATQQQMRGAAETAVLPLDHHRPKLPVRFA